MQKTFKNVPVEEDTKIKVQKEIEINNINALYQKWTWDGTLGHSIIFHNCDVEEMGDDEIIQLINSSETDFNVAQESTISRSESGFTFINFGFETF